MRFQKLLILALLLTSPVAAFAQTISSIAGGGTTGVNTLVGSVGGPSVAAKDSLGNTYILDCYLNRLFKVDTSGNLTIVVGNSTLGYAGNGVPATPAVVLNGPRGLFIDSHNNIFIADADNAIVREIAGVTGTQYGIAMTAGYIYTIAGTATELGFSGDGGPATSATLAFPDGLWVDANGDVFIADKGNDVIRVVYGSPAPAGKTTGNIDTVAGTPDSAGYSGDGGLATSAQMNWPWDVYGDSSGNLYIADLNNNAIREVTAADGKMHTFAGTAAGATVNVSLNGPLGIYVDAGNNVFITDTSNQVIRKVAATTNALSIVAGQVSVRGNSGNGAPATGATLNFPSDVWSDSSGNLFIANTDGGTVLEVLAAAAECASTGTMLAAGDICTVDGNGHPFYAGDGGAPTNATLGFPTGVATDPSGDTFIADTSNHAIREVSGGTISTVVGVDGSDGFAEEGTPATVARLEEPNGAFVDAAGDIFIADTGNSIVRMVPSTSGTYFGISMTGGDIYTIAGVDPVVSGDTITPQPGYNGDGMIATSAMLNSPFAVFVDNLGNVYIADTGNDIIRMVPKVSGTYFGTPMTANDIYTIAGVIPTGGSPGTPQPGYNGDGVAIATQLNGPQALCVDSFGNLFIADTNNQLVREVAAVAGTNMTIGNLYTLAGTAGASGTPGDGGPATSANLSSPTGVFVDPAGDIFIADTGDATIREVVAGTINTVAGTELTPGFAGDGGLATAAQLNLPQTLAYNSAANALEFADSNNVRIRAITGAGLYTNPGFSVSTSSLTFTQQAEGFASAAQSIVLLNTSASTTVTFSLTAGGANPGDFPYTTTCTGSLGAGTSCTISVKFDPTATGARGAIISIANSATATQTVTLAGTGVAPGADFSTTSLTFDNQPVGTTSTAQAIVITNNGAVTLNSISVSVAGPNAGDFAQTNNCPASLPNTGTNFCTINVTFTPTAAGARNASVMVTDSAPSSPQMVTLTGTGTAPAVTLSPSTVNFAASDIGTTERTTPPTPSVTLTNSGTAAMTINSIVLGGANSGDFVQTNTCPTGATQLPANASCTFTITFTPTAAGARTATITISDNAPGSPQVITLNGTGTSPTTTLSIGAISGGSTSQTVNAGGTATYNLQISATGGNGAINVTITCSGAPSESTCNPPSSPVSVTPGAAATPFTVTVTTTAPSMLAPGSQSDRRIQAPLAIRTLPLTILSLLVFIAALLTWMQSPAGRMRTVRVAFAACLILMPIAAATVLVGCGGGSSSSAPPPPPSGGTPSGTYTLTLKATASNGSLTTNLTLIVQ